jgi:ferredoxin
VCTWRFEVCEFCKKHGQGNRWFLNPDNYSDKMMEDRERQELIEEIVGYGIDYYQDFSSKVTNLAKWPVLSTFIKMAVKRLAPKEHGGQVVSLEDSLEIVSLAKNFVLLECSCKKLVTHGEELCCLNFGPVRDMQKSMLPDGAMEELTLAEAQEFLKGKDKEGRIHQVLYAKVPMPVCVCNCDLRWCTSFKQRFPYDIPLAVLKGHDVVAIDEDMCIGCGGDPPCVERCGFGALRYDESQGKVVVDIKKCFGCGLCWAVCEQDALRVVPRSSVLEVARSW